MGQLVNATLGFGASSLGTRLISRYVSERLLVLHGYQCDDLTATYLHVTASRVTAADSGLCVCVGPRGGDQPLLSENTVIA